MVVSVVGIRGRFVHFGWFGYSFDGLTLVWVVGGLLGVVLVGF